MRSTQISDHLNNVDTWQFVLRNDSLANTSCEQHLCAIFKKINFFKVLDARQVWYRCCCILKTQEKPDSAPAMNGASFSLVGTTLLTSSWTKSPVITFSRQMLIRKFQPIGLTRNSARRRKAFDLTARLALFKHDPICSNYVLMRQWRT